MQLLSARGIEVQPTGFVSRDDTKAELEKPFSIILALTTFFALFRMLFGIGKLMLSPLIAYIDTVKAK